MNRPESKVDRLLDRLHNERINNSMPPPEMSSPAPRRPRNLTFDNPARRPHNLPFSSISDNAERQDRHGERLREIMKNSGKLKIDGTSYTTKISDLDHMEELGNGTCGHVVKMRHKLSNKVIAVKQMRRTGNNEENKRIVMDIEVVIKSHDCNFIVQCLGCFITEAEVWICMELMATCFDKLLKRLKKPIPERILGKVTVATIEALSYLKDKHDIIHRDVKPSNILLDEKGNVKLCDFGISGRLVDSLAATKSAGCTAYLAIIKMECQVDKTEHFRHHLLFAFNRGVKAAEAVREICAVYGEGPERIEIDPNSPDYDIRADVWSLGITLVELATGTFPYKDCKTDFEVLTKVVGQEPPTLPDDQDFSQEFRSFVNCCLIKDKKKRPKYVKLKNEAFYKKYEKADVDVGDWFLNAIREADARDSSRHTPAKRIPHIRQHSEPPPSITNGSSNHPPVQSLGHDEGDARTVHLSRITSFQRGAGHERQYRTISPFQAFHNHLQAKNQAALNENNGQQQQRDKFTSPLFHRRCDSNSRESRWHSPAGSPLPLRNHHIAIDESVMPYNCGNTSPIVLQRFYHQQKQQQAAKEAEELAKCDPSLGRKRIASYIKLQLNSDRSGRSSRHQSPDPPPRLNRGVGDQSPLALRRNIFENNLTTSPALSRRYISPTPPVPPPRRLSESTSVPGSPQHVRARFHYTPEPQRRLFQNNDVS